MVRLIDVNKVIDSMQECLDESPDEKHSVAYFAFEKIIEHLKQEPTVDAVPVVRCRDCKWLYDEMDDYCCRSHRGLVRICENSFCSYGELKDGDDE